MKLVFCTVYLAGIGVISNLVGEALPRALFHSDRVPFLSRPWEKNGAVFERIGIKRWKDKLPDISRLRPSMLPKRLDRKGPDQPLEQLIQETCIAETVHAGLIPAGWICALICAGWKGILISALWSAGNLPFLLVQRYNRPRLKRLCGRIHSQSEKTNTAERNDINASFDFNL